MIRKHVLIVDDEADIRELLVLTLGRMGVDAEAVSSIKEARDAGASDSECIAIGLERPGRIVTAAALLFAVAIGAFATSQILFVKENGVGTALAVLIDASIIRALLVPSLMELLGKWNWWAPAPLRRVYERFGISETAPAEPERA